MPVKQHHRENGRRLLALVNRALVENGVSRSRLSDELGRDAAQVTRVLDGDGNLPADLVAAVLELDRDLVVLAGLAAARGFALVSRAPDPAEEARRYRAELLDLKARLDKVLEGT
jgi:cyanate lyase